LSFDGGCEYGGVNGEEGIFGELLLQYRRFVGGLSLAGCRSHLHAIDLEYSTCDDGNVSSSFPGKPSNGMRLHAAWARRDSQLVVASMTDRVDLLAYSCGYSFSRFGSRSWCHTEVLECEARSIGIAARSNRVEERLGCPIERLHRRVDSAATASLCWLSLGRD
jgi:hypothetical protein